MPYARTDDRVKIYYEEHGPTEAAADRPPLVLAYGIGGNADLWDVNVPALAARRRVVLWEPRGHARSDSPEDPARYSFARWTLDLKAVLDHLRLRTAHVGGLSLGAGIATRFTLAFPHRVARAGDELVVGRGSARVRRQSGHARAIDRGDADQGHERDGGVLDGRQSHVANRLAIDPSSKDEFYAYYRPSPDRYANSLRALLAMDHITDRLRARVPCCYRRGPGPVAGADARHAPEGPRLQADRACAGQPLCQPRSAGGVEPRGRGVSRAL